MSDGLMLDIEDRDFILDDNDGELIAEFHAVGLAGPGGKSAYEVWLEQPGNADKAESEFFEFIAADAVALVQPLAVAASADAATAVAAAVTATAKAAEAVQGAVDAEDARAGAVAAAALAGDAVAAVEAASASASASEATATGAAGTANTKAAEAAASATAAEAARVGAVAASATAAVARDAAQGHAAQAAANADIQQHDYAGAGPHVLDGSFNYVRVNHTAPVEVHIPLDMPAPVGKSLAVFQLGAGQVRIVADAGVTIRTAETLYLRKQNSGAVLVRAGANSYDLVGDLEAAP